MKRKAKILWEILVPKFSNDKRRYSISYHKEWDKKVEMISGGLTILRTAKGRWINPDKKLFAEAMIPVRIYSSEKEIDKIMKLTLEHYKQDAVFCYLVSNKVKILRRK